MAVPSWPAAVPFVNQADNATASASFTAPIASETEAGPPIMRPRPGPRSTELAWRSQPLDDEQWAALDQFLRVDLRQGTLVFDMPVFRPGQGWVTRKCQIKVGTIANDFGQVPYTLVSFTLIIWNW